MLPLTSTSEQKNALTWHGSQHQRDVFLTVYSANEQQMNIVSEITTWLVVQR